jgi:hypothetical protein
MGETELHFLMHGGTDPVAVEISLLGPSPRVWSE